MTRTIHRGSATSVVNHEQPTPPEKIERLYIGIDNGVSGSIGVIPASGVGGLMFFMPTRLEQNYTKTKKNITRIDWRKLDALLAMADGDAKVFLERPMVNPGRFQATASALRAMEATLICVERRGLALQYVDSKEWQRVMLPQGTKGPEELKDASADIGRRLFPGLFPIIDKHGDADGLLMAEWARRERL